MEAARDSNPSLHFERVNSDQPISRPTKLSLSCFDGQAAPCRMAAISCRERVGTTAEPHRGHRRRQVFAHAFQEVVGQRFDRESEGQPDPCAGVLRKCVPWERPPLLWRNDARCDRQHLVLLLTEVWRERLEERLTRIGECFAVGSGAACPKALRCALCRFKTRNHGTVLGVHSREELLVFRRSLQEERVQEFVLRVMMDMKEPKQLTEIVGEAEGTLGVCFAHRRDLIPCVVETTPERFVYGVHVANVGQIRIVGGHRVPLSCGRTHFARCPRCRSTGIRCRVINPGGRREEDPNSPGFGEYLHPFSSQSNHSSIGLPTSATAVP